MNENNVRGHSNTGEDVEKRWFAPVNRIGQFTLTIAMILSFLPFIYVALRYNVMPPSGAIAVGIFNVSSAFVVAWIVEPISYFPALGTAGSYMGILAGSIGQMRVPAALVAKEVAGVEENTQEAEIIATCGIAGSVFMNIIITTLTALAGAVIISFLPEIVLRVMSAYILPAIFGAVLAMFTTKGKIQITIPVVILTLGINYLVKIGAMPSLLSKFTMLICVIIGIVVARIEYKQGWAK